MNDDYRRGLAIMVGATRKSGRAIVGADWPPGAAYMPLDRTMVTSPYGQRRGDSSTGDHRGTDFRAAVGTAVRAPRDGYIVFTLDNLENDARSGYYGYGGIVCLWHPLDGVYTWFAHLDSVAASRSRGIGALVYAGQIIGRTGKASGTPPKYPDMGPHLHMEVWNPYPGSETTLRAFLTSHTRRGGRAPFPHTYGLYTLNPEHWLARFGFVLNPRQAIRVMVGSTAANSPPPSDEVRDFDPWTAPVEPGFSAAQRASAAEIALEASRYPNVRDWGSVDDGRAPSNRDMLISLGRAIGWMYARPINRLQYGLGDFPGELIERWGNAVIAWERNSPEIGLVIGSLRLDVRTHVARDTQATGERPPWDSHGPEYRPGLPGTGAGPNGGAGMAIGLIVVGAGLAFALAKG